MAANKPTHIIGILGVRDYNGSVYENYEYVAATLDEHVKRHESPEGFGILTGGGRGVESLVVKWAEDRKIPLRKIPPNINQFGPKKAFTVRNNNIVAESHDVVVFWDGYTDVTTDALMSAMHLQKRATVYPLV
jgi:hypothetical protein